MLTDERIEQMRREVRRAELKFERNTSARILAKMILELLAEREQTEHAEEAHP
jgi:hypothetical protein